MVVALLVTLACGGCRGWGAVATQPALQPAAAVAPVSGDVTRLTGVPGPGQADFEIRVDPAALASHGLTAPAISAAVSKFFETYPMFSLTDLQDLPIATAGGGGGGSVRLRDVAEVEVWFGASRTQVVVREPKK